MHFFVFPPGETAKTRTTKEWIEDGMLEAKMDRNSALIALGGGVTTDLGGFVASTYLRGIPLILIPTTLLGMVDASVGGKNGVNTACGKNLIGTFYQSELILIDPECLATLPAAQMRSGKAEIIKYALTLDPELLSCETLEEKIRRCVALKTDIVSEDPHDRGRRHILNFGHTVGHALEAVSEFTLAHGDAVAVGMLIEALMSVELGFLKEDVILKIFSILEEFPVCSIDSSSLFSHMNYDKKGKNFVVLTDFGKVLECGGTFCHPIEPEILEQALGRYEQLTCKA